jgi:Ribonuclease G/E
MAVIRASRSGEIVRVALLEGDTLREFWLWNRAHPDGVGDRYTGRVTAVLPALAGCFVALGGEQSGFLPDSAGGRGLSEGSYLTVQVTRAPQGDKGPRLARSEDAPGASPGLVARGPGPLLELAARFPTAPVLADDYALMAELKQALDGRLRYDAKAFDAVLEDEVAGLAAPITALPGGAKLHITPAPAATLLDIDAASGSATAPLALNAAILPELCRQIVLRNLSGGILIDFAGMKAAVRRRLEAPLRHALVRDPLRPEFLGFSHLGFAELTRRRIRPPLHEVLSP